VRLSWGAVLPLALMVTAATAGLAWRAGRLRRHTAVTGKEAMAGKIGTVVIAIADTPGQVNVEGERWRAVADVPIAAGERVRIAGMDGLTIRVAPLSEPPGQEQTP
jgi:membrane-bound serine protease (ClpP class)